MHGFIETIDGHNVMLPSGGIVSVPGGFGGRQGVHQGGVPAAFYQFGAFESFGKTILIQPLQVEGFLRLNVAAFNVLAQIKRKS